MWPIVQRSLIRQLPIRNLRHNLPVIPHPKHPVVSHLPNRDGIQPPTSQKTANTFPLPPLSATISIRS